MDTVNLFIAVFTCIVAVGYILMFRARRQSRLIFRSRVEAALKQHVNRETIERNWVGAR